MDHRSARSQNWVILNSTSTISWSTIWSVYPEDSYYGNGLMYAYTPWSGHYEVNDAIWTSAHHTQFYAPGDLLLLGSGRGMLAGGGSYMTAISADRKDFTLVLETMQGNCLRCSGGTTSTQTLTFALVGGGLPTAGTSLAVWQTIKGASFVAQPDVIVAADGTITVTVPADGMLTVSTVRTASHGSFPGSPIPADTPFPLPYADNFDSALYDMLPKYFGDQGGSFAVRHGVVQQVVPADPGPNGWGGNRDPYSLLGDKWADVVVQVAVSFDGSFPDRGDGAPPATDADRAGVSSGNTAAAVRPCDALSPGQRWQFGKVATNYLSLASSAGSVCLDLPGCDTGAALDYYECVTTDCACGCPGFKNLQYVLGAGGALTTPMQSGDCVTATSSNTLVLKACQVGSDGQVWTYNATTMELRVNAPGASKPLCLDAPAPPPPPAPYAGITARAPTYSGAKGEGYTFVTRADASWQLRSGDAIIASGNVTIPYNSSAWHLMSLTTKGTQITARLDGAQLATVSDSAYSAGQVAIGSGYHRAAFDNFSVTPA